MSTTLATKPTLFQRLPIVSHLRQSIGVQRGMLIAGLVISGVFVIAAIFAPVIAPYGYAESRDEGGIFGKQLPPSPEHIWGTTVGGFDVFSRVVWGTQAALAVVVVAIVLSIFIGVVLGLVSGYLGGWLDRILIVIADAIYPFPTLTAHR